MFNAQRFIPPRTHPSTWIRHQSQASLGNVLMVLHGAHNYNPDTPQPKILDKRRYAYRAESPYCNIQCQQNESDDSVARRCVQSKQTRAPQGYWGPKGTVQTQSRMDAQTRVTCGKDYRLSQTTEVDPAENEPISRSCGWYSFGCPPCDTGTPRS